MVVTILNQVMATDKPDYIYQTLAKSISDASNPKVTQVTF